MFCGPHQNVNTDCLTLAQKGNCYHDDPINDQKNHTFAIAIKTRENEGHALSPCQVRCAS